MPFGCRNIEPSRLGAHDVPQDQELERKGVLTTVANNAIVGALLQLSSLVRHADDLFCDISDECQKVVERTEKISKRIQNIGTVISKLDAKQAKIPEGDLKQFTTISSHHQARHGYDASLFLQTNRPQCVQDLYTLCAPNPTRVIRAADLYRKDGLSGSKMFKCWPVIMNEQTIKTPDLNLPRRVQRVRSFEKKYKTLKIRERPKTIHGWDDFTLDDCKNEITEEKKKKPECLTTPEPPVVVSIDTSGSNFERMQSMRTSGRRYQSKEEREKKKRRRRTVSGVENIMSEIEKFERKHKDVEGGPRSTPRSYSFDDLDTEDDMERDEGIMKYLDEIDGKMEERIGEEKAQKIMKFFPCRRSKSLPRCIKLSSVSRSLSADRKSQRDFNTSYVSSTLSIASMASNASSRLSRSAKRSSIISNKIKSLVTNVKDKPKPRPKSLDIDTFLDAKASPRSSIEEQDRSKSTYSLERNHNHSVPDNLLSRGYSRESSSSTVGPGSYYNFESSTLPRAQAKKYDFPWESLPKDWTTSVKLREISKRRAKEDRQSSSGNWSQSGTSSNRHSLDSDLRSEGFKFNSQYSLGKDSGRDSLTLEEENDCVTDGTSTAGYAADSQSTVTGDSISVGNPKSDFTTLDTEAWIQSLAVRAAKREEAESKDKSSTLSKLTRQNILALDLMLAEGKPKAIGDEESSVYSVDQEGFYTSFHNDSGLKKSTNTLVDEEDVDFSPTKDSGSVCSAESVIHRPFGDSDKFAGLRKNSHSKVLSKVTPPTPPRRTSSQKSNGEVTPVNKNHPELHSFPSQDSTVSESDAEAVFTRVHDKTNLSSTGFPSLVALSTSDDESSPESKAAKNQQKGLEETVSELGLSDLRDTSGFSYLSFQTGSSLESSKSDGSFSSLRHSKSALECTDQGYDSLTIPRNRDTASSNKNSVGYQSWPRSHKTNPTSGILKTPEKQLDGVRPPKTLNFAPVVNLFREGAQNSIQMPLPSPTSSSSSEISMPHMSSFQTPAQLDESYSLSMPIEQKSSSKNNQGKHNQSNIPSKYQPVIKVTPRSRSKSGDRLSQGSDRGNHVSENGKTPDSGGRQMIYTSSKPTAQSTPQVPSSQGQEKQASPILYAVSPVMAPRDPSRQNSVTSTGSNNSGYMDMQSLKSASSLSSLASSEGLHDNSTYMSMSSPCSSPNLSNMDFSMSSTPSGSMDSLLDMRKTPTNELENDTYQVNTSLHMNQYHKSARSKASATETVPIVTQGNSRGHNGMQVVDSKQSFGSFRTPNTSYTTSKPTPGRRSLDSTGNDLTNVTQMSFDSTMGSTSTPVSRNSGTPTSRDSPSGQNRQQGRRSRADTRKEPSYRNYNASNRRSLPSDTSVQIRNVPLNDSHQGVSANQSHYKSQGSMSSSNSCPLGFNSVLVSNSGYNSGQKSAKGQNVNRQSRESPTSNGDVGQFSSRSDSYRVALNGPKGSRGTNRTAMHQSKSMPVLPPSRKSGPFRVAMDMSPNRAYNNNEIEDDVMSRADSYRIAVRNTNGLGTEVLNRNTSYRVAVNDEISSMLNSKLDALGMDNNKLMSGRDVRRMGITDVDQVKDINPKPVMRETKSAVQLRSRDSKSAPQALGPNTNVVKRPSSQQQTKSDGRIRQCFKQDIDPIQVVATVDINNESKKSSKNNPNRSSTYIQFDPIFEDTEDFQNAADLDMTSFDYSKNLSDISKSKFSLINGTVKDANANTVKLKKSKSAKDMEIEDNWRFSQV